MVNYLLFGLLALFWGGSFVAIKTMIAEVPSFTGAFYRVFFSMLFLFIIYARKLKLPPGFWGKELLMSSFAGLCSIGIPFSLLFWGELYVSPSIAAVLNGTVPFWTLIIAVIAFNGRKDVTFLKSMGLIVGFIGISMIFGPKIYLKGDVNEVYGLIAITLMAVSYAVGINLNKRLLANHKIVTKNLNTIVQQVSSVIYLVILCLIIDGPFDTSVFANPKVSLSVLYLSLFSTCLAFIIFYKLIQEMGPVKASTVTFFVPPISLVLDALIFNRQLTMMEIAGAMVIIFSMILLKDRKLKVKKLDVTAQNKIKLASS